MSIQFLTSLLQYRGIKSFSEGFMPVLNNNSNWIFIDKNGNEQFGLEFDDVVHNFRDGLAKVELNGQTGVIDTTGKFYRLPDEFKDAEFYSGLAFVKINEDENGYGFIDKTGEIKICGLYKTRDYEFYKFKGNYACVCGKEPDGYSFSFRRLYSYPHRIIDKSGKTIIDNVSYKHRTFHMEDKMYYHDFYIINGTKLIQVKGEFNPRFIITNILNKLSIHVDVVGWRFPYDNKSNLLAIKKTGKFGFIDMDTGNTVIPFKYDNCSGFSDGLAFVKIGNWKGFINKSDEIIIDNLNYDIYDDDKFQNEFLSPSKNGLRGLIDKTGREIIPPEYDEEIIINENIGKIEKNGQSGFVYLYPTSNGVVPIFCFEPFYGNDSTEIIIDKTKVKINRNGQLLDDNNGYIHPEILADFNSRSPSYHQNNDDYKSDNFKSDDSKVENFQQKLNIPLSDIPLWIKIFPELEGYSLDKLEKFLLQQTEICCYYLEKLPESIGQLQNLQKLDLSFCGNLTTLPESIGQLQNLRHCELCSNENLTTLPESIGQLQNLQELNLSYCENLTTLPESIGQLQNLQELNLISCKNLTTLPESIGQLQNLQTLGLGGCDNLITQLDSIIIKLQHLQKLSFFDYKNLTTLPESIGQLQNLQVLDLKGCKNLSTLPESIGQLQNLQTLYLSHCDNLTTLPESIGQLQNLQALFLSRCENFTTLPESIGRLQNLRHWELCGNKNLTTLPESIGQLHNLQELHLRDCENLTTLPESISQLQQLQYLDLSYCKNLTLSKSIINLSKHCEILTDD